MLCRDFPVSKKGENPHHIPYGLATMCGWFHPFRLFTLAHQANGPWVKTVSNCAIKKSKSCSETNRRPDTTLLTTQAHGETFRCFRVQRPAFQIPQNRDPFHPLLRTVTMGRQAPQPGARIGNSKGEIRKCCTTLSKATSPPARPP